MDEASVEASNKAPENSAEQVTELRQEAAKTQAYLRSLESENESLVKVHGVADA